MTEPPPPSDQGATPPLEQLLEQRAAAQERYDRAESLEERLAALKESFHFDHQILQVQIEHERERALPRPTKGWLGLMCRGLGPLPEGLTTPSFSEYPDARRYRFLPFLTLLIPLSLVIAARTLAPGGASSPITGAARIAGGDAAAAIASYVVLGLVVLFVIAVTIWLGGLRNARAFLVEAALSEEIWFRFGAEHWSARTRVRACAQFGIAHLVNMVVAFVTLGGLAIVGGVFMAVYLREYRESGDPRRAALVSADFHYRYNLGALALIVLGLALIAVLTVVLLLAS